MGGFPPAVKKTVIAFPGLKIQHFIYAACLMLLPVIYLLISYLIKKWVRYANVIILWEAVVAYI